MELHVSRNNDSGESSFGEHYHPESEDLEDEVISHYHIEFDTIMEMMAESEQFDDAQQKQNKLTLLRKAFESYPFVSGLKCIFADQKKSYKWGQMMPPFEVLTKDQLLELKQKIYDETGKNALIIDDPYERDIEEVKFKPHEKNLNISTIENFFDYSNKLKK